MKRLLRKLVPLKIKRAYWLARVEAALHDAGIPEDRKDLHRYPLLLKLELENAEAMRKPEKPLVFTQADLDRVRAK